MARTIADIKSEMTTAFMANTTLQQKYGFAAGTAFDKHFSKVSLESLILYIVAAAIWTLEKLFDTHTAEVNDYIATMKPHSLRWYVEKAKAFLYGVPLIDGTDTYNTATLSDDDLASAKIIAFAACTEDNATLYMKVAAAGPRRLTADEKDAFVAYIQEVKDAGVRVEVISDDGDFIIIPMTIYYNPLLMTEDGSSKSPDTYNSKLVEEAVQAYIENLPFNGEFRENDLVDAIQQVSGVEMVKLGTITHSVTGNTDDWETVNAACQPVAGYFTFNREHEGLIIHSTNINYIAYGQD